MIIKLIGCLKKISIWFPEKKDDRYDGDDSTSEDEDDDEDEEDENEDAEEDPEKKQAKLDEKLKRKNEFFAKRNWRSQRHEREEFHKSKKVNYWESLKCLPWKSRIYSIIEHFGMFKILAAFTLRGTLIN